MKSRTTLALILATTALAVVGVALFLCFGSVIKVKIGEDVFKLSYEFLLIVVIGGALSLLHQQFSEERALTEKRNSDERALTERRNALLREMHSELLNGYNIAKRARRMLRAHVGSPITQEKGVHASEYDKQIDKIMDAQLMFEVYAERADDAGLWFANGKELAVELDKVADYLKQIIEEYEDKRNTFVGTPPSQALSELTALAEFVGPYNQAKDFKDKFKYPFRKALTLLVQSEFI